MVLEILIFRQKYLIICIIRYSCFFTSLRLGMFKNNPKILIRLPWKLQPIRKAFFDIFSFRQKNRRTHDDVYLQAHTQSLLTDSGYARNSGIIAQPIVAQNSCIWDHCLSSCLGSLALVTSAGELMVYVLPGILIQYILKSKCRNHIT